MSPQSTSLLDVIQVASPCDVPWESMAGDDRVRHCKQCSLNVYNLSELTRDDAEQLLQQHTGRLCVRYFKRHDGTVITRDCPVGLRAIRLRVAKSLTAAATLTFGLLVGTFSAGCSFGMQPKAHPFRELLSVLIPKRPFPANPAQGNMMIQGDVCITPPAPPTAAPLPPKITPLPDPALPPDAMPFPHPPLTPDDMPPPNLIGDPPHIPTPNLPAVPFNDGEATALDEG